MAEAFLTRLHFPRSTVARRGRPGPQPHVHVRGLLERRRGPAVHRADRAHGLEELFELREADNVGSGLPPETGLVELRRRVTEQLEAHVALTLQGPRDQRRRPHARARSCAQGPEVGRILESLLDQVIADSALNDRPTLLLLAQSMLEADR